MSSDKDHIKNKFASAFRDYKPEVPVSVWNRIEADLAAKHGHQVLPRKRVWLRVAAVAACAAAIMTAILVIRFDEPTPNAPQQASVVDKQANTANENQAQLIAETLKEEAPFQNAVVETTKTNYNKSNTTPYNTIKKEKVTDKRSESTSTIEPIKNINYELLAEKTTCKGVDIISDRQFELELARKIAELQHAGNNDIIFAENFSSQRNKDKGLGVGVKGTSSFASANNTERIQQAKPTGSILRSQTIKMEHAHPITFGLNVNKRLTDKLSLETGVSYTYLSSKSVPDKIEETQFKKQEFHYLGVPLSLNYTFMDWKKLQAYISVGGAVQKDFYGKVSNRKYLEDLIDWVESSKVNVSQSNAQFSATSSLGVSYPIYNKLKVYTTVGGAYYFDTKNEYQTIYSEKKWMLNLNLGLKFDF